LEVVEEAFPALRHDEIAVRVAVALLDPSSFPPCTRAVSPEVSFSGVISEVGAAVPKRLSLGQTVIGIGPLADFLSLPSSEVRCLPDNSHLNPHQEAAIPYLCSFLHVLRTSQIKPEDRILITGQAVIRHLSEQLLKVLFPDTSITRINLPSGHDVAREAGRAFDVLVHGVTDPLDLQSGLAALVEHGQALLLVPPGRHVLALDFYPNVHRSCLRLLARKVGKPCRRVSCPDPGHPLLLQLLEQESVDLNPILLHVSNSSEVARLPLERINRSEKLLAVTWP
jgi:hypothetical protein